MDRAWIYVQPTESADTIFVLLLCRRETIMPPPSKSFRLPPILVALELLIIAVFSAGANDIPQLNLLIR
jgi:hypothetical protein